LLSGSAFSGKPSLTLWCDFVIKEIIMAKHILGLALVCLLNGAAAGAFAAKDPLDPLAQSGIQSRQSAQVLMTSVVRADKRLVACGERGVVLLSDDSGKRWRQASSVPVSVTLTKLYFVDSMNGWAIGHSGVVLKTSDAGETWIKQLDGYEAARLEQVSSQEDGSSEERIQTADYLVQDGADKPFLGIYFADAQHGIVLGAYGLAFETRDGGSNWQSLMGRIADPRGRHLYAVAQQGQTIYLAGEQGALFRSDDGGQHFAALDIGWDGSLFGILPSGQNELIVYGLRGRAFKSYDRGESWQAMELPESTLVAGQKLADGAFVLAADTGQLLISRDAMSFTPLNLSVSAPVSSFVETADGHLVFAGAHNLSRQSIE
jgi:photosystem II stability/assembly factor-like uncharacterized protein